MLGEVLARYFDVEPRYVPLTPTPLHRSASRRPWPLVAFENTIGVVGILGSTYTGQYEPIAALDATLTRPVRRAQHRTWPGMYGASRDANGWDWDVPLHVDAASGRGSSPPFLTPELLWDFRLPTGCTPST